MRCKVGDLAVVVRSFAGNEGKIVRCLRLQPRQPWIRAIDGSYFEAPSWETDAILRTFSGDLTTLVEDSNLRPIRDEPGQDETLTWKSLPSPVEIIKEHSHAK